MSLSLQELARRVETSPSHIFHIENGEKVPNEHLAARVARALGEDEDVFRAWARARQRSDFYTAATSADVVRRYLSTRPASASMARYAEARKIGAAAKEGQMLWSLSAPEGESPGVAGEFVRPDAAPEAAAMMSSTAYRRGAETPQGPRPARLLIPVVADGGDPGDDAKPANAIDVVRIDPRALRSIEELERPFAYPLSPEFTRRVAGILPARGHAVLTRRRARPVPHEVYAVRAVGAVVLSRVMWNGRQLLLLPAPGASDFELLPAENEAGLDRLVVGMVVLVRAEG